MNNKIYRYKLLIDWVIFDIMIANIMSLACPNYDPVE